MSQQPPNPFSKPQSFDQPMQPEATYVAPVKKENGMGLTGFIVSLVGLFLCGVPSLIGLILSAIGLKKEPRGLAIAGVILGVIGLIQLAGTAVLGYQWIRSMQQTFIEINSMHAETQLEEAAAEIGYAWEKQQQIPTQEEGDALLNGKNDMMNNSLVYETDGTTFSIRSAGADGVLETEDDIVVGPFEDPQTAIDSETDLIDPEDGESEAEAENPSSNPSEGVEAGSDDAVGESAAKPGDLMEN